MNVESEQWKLSIRFKCVVAIVEVMLRIIHQWNQTTPKLLATPHGSIFIPRGTHQWAWNFPQITW